MERKRTKVDYRQLYKEHYGLEFGSDMEVHHIDFDRSNNDINNLLLLPSSLHSKYHFVYSMLFGIKYDQSLQEELRLTGPMVPIHYSQWLRKMAETLEEIQPWITMKIDFEMLPRDIFKAAYHTGCPIKPNFVEGRNGRNQVDQDSDRHL